MTEDEATHGYYIVQWTLVPYTLQEEIDEFQEGELVCDATYCNPVGRARNWYTPGTTPEENALIRIQTVVVGSLDLLEPSEMVKLPQTCNRRKATKKGVLRLSDSSHEEILDEIKRRDALNFEEDIGEDTDDDASTDGRSDEEQSSEEDDDSNSDAV